MSLDLSKYPKVQAWMDEVSEPNRLGGMHLLDDALSSFHKTWAVQMLQNDHFSSEQQKWARAVRLISYDHPVLNETWKNQVVTDGQRVFIPQQWLLQFIDQPLSDQPGHDIPFSEAFLKRMNEVVEKYPNFDQNAEQTKQDFIEAGLSFMVDRLLKAPKTIPLDVLEKAWRENSAIPEAYQQPFLDFFKKLERFNESMAPSTPEFGDFRDELIDFVFQHWGDDFTWGNQLIPDVLFQEWIRHNKGENWTAKDLSNQPRKLQQIWGLTGILNHFLNYNSGTSAFLRSHCLGDAYDGSNYNEDLYWWKKTCRDVDEQGRVMLGLSFFYADEKDEIIDAISNTHAHLGNMNFEPFREFAALRSPLIHLNQNQITQNEEKVRRENMFARLILKDIEYLEAYMEALKQDGWKDTLDSCLSYQNKDLQQQSGSSSPTHTLWWDFLRYFNEQFSDDDGNPLSSKKVAKKMGPVMDKLDFLIEHGLTLQSELAQEDFWEWFTYVNLKDEHFSLSLTKRLLDTQSSSSKTLLDSFLAQSKQEFEQEMAQGNGWKPKVSLGKRLTFLLDGLWINWKDFSKEEKHHYFDQIGMMPEQSLKDVLISLQRQEMQESLQDSKGMINKVRI